MIALSNHGAGSPARCFANAVLMQRRSMPIPACGPAAQAAPTNDVVHSSGPCMPGSFSAMLVGGRQAISGVTVRLFPRGTSCRR